MRMTQLNAEHQPPFGEPTASVAAGQPSAPIPITPPPKGCVNAMFSSIKDSFRAGVRRIALAKELHNLNTRKSALVHELDCVFITIGKKAQPLYLAIPGATEAFKAVDESQQHLDKCKDAVSKHSNDVQHCRDELTALQKVNAERRKQHEEEHAAAAKAADSIDAVRRQTSETLLAIDREIKGHKPLLADAAAGRPTPKPIESLLADMKVLEGRQAEHVVLHTKAASDAAAANEAANQKRITLSNVTVEIANQEHQLALRISGHQRACATAEQQVKEAETRLKLASKSLGRALYETKALSPDFAELTTHADSIVAPIAEIEDSMRDVQSKIANIAPAVRRLLYGIAALIVVVVGLTLLLTSKHLPWLGSGMAHARPPAQSKAAETDDDHGSVESGGFSSWWRRSAGASKKDALVIKGLYIGMSIEDAHAQLSELFRKTTWTVHDVEHLDSGSWYVSAVAYTNYDSAPRVQLWADSTTREVKQLLMDSECVDILFNVSDMDAEAFVQEFLNNYGIPSMEVNVDSDLMRLGLAGEPVITWQYRDPRGFLIGITKNKQLELQRIASSAERKFD